MNFEARVTRAARGGWGWIVYNAQGQAVDKFGKETVLSFLREAHDPLPLGGFATTRFGARRAARRALTNLRRYHTANPEIVK